MSKSLFPAPIFNRKRPRQALFAHPNNKESTNVQDDHRQKEKFIDNVGRLQNDYAHPNGSFNAQIPVQYNQNNFGVRRCQFNQNNIVNTNISENINSNRNLQQSFSSVQKEQTTYSENVNRSSDLQFNSNPTQNSYQVNAHQNSVGEHSFYNFHNNRLAHVTQSNLFLNDKTQFEPSNENYNSHPCGQNPNLQSYTCKPPGTYGLQTVGPPRANHIQTITTPTFGIQAPGLQSLPTGSTSQSYGQKFTGTNPPANNKTTNRGSVIANNNSENKKALPRSKNQGKAHQMIILNLSITKMKEVAIRKLTTPVLYSLIGTVNSSTASDEEYKRKSFTLKDYKGSTSCIFYEIDRTMPTLSKGQLYRCIGTFDLQNEIFKCISVRIATDEEKRTQNLFIRASEKEIDKLCT